LVQHFLAKGGTEILSGYLNKVPLSSLLFLMLLGIANHGIEIIKWKYLAERVEKHIGWRRIIRSHFGGFSLGSVTPGRVGETAGRAILLPQGKRRTLFLLSLNSSFSLFISSMLMGLVPMYFFFPNHRFSAIMILLTLALSFIFIFPKSLHRIADQFRINPRLFRLFETPVQIRVLSLSLIRVFIYSLQLSIALGLSAGLENLSSSFSVAALYYGVITLLPSVLLSEIGVRGSAMMLIASLTGINYTHYLAPLAFIWVLNVAIPALAGTLSFIKRPE
jgi:hypothetical protein